MVNQIKRKLVLKNTSYPFYWLIIPTIQYLLVNSGILYLRHRYTQLEVIAFIFYGIFSYILFKITTSPFRKLEQGKTKKTRENAEEYYKEYDNDRTKQFLPDDEIVSISKAKKRINSTDGLLYFGIISCISVEILYYVIGPIKPVELIIFTSIELILITILIWYNCSKIICIRFIDDNTIEFSNRIQKSNIKINDIQSIYFHGNDIELLINYEKVHFNVTSDYDFVDIFKVIITKCGTKIGEGLRLAIYKDKCTREGIDENDEVYLNKVMQNNSSKIIYWIAQIVQFILVMPGIVYFGVIYNMNEDDLIRLAIPISFILFMLTQFPLMRLVAEENKNNNVIQSKNLQDIINESEKYFSNREHLLTQDNNNTHYYNKSNIIMIIINLFMLSVLCYLIFGSDLSSQDNIIAVSILITLLLINFFLWFFTIKSIKFINNDIIEISSIKQKIEIEINKIKEVEILYDSFIIIKTNEKNLELFTLNNHIFFDSLKKISFKSNAEIGPKLKLALYLDKKAQDILNEKDNDNL